MGRKRPLLIVSALAVLLATSYYFTSVRQIWYPPGMSSVEKAALKAARIQEKELEEVTKALAVNDAGRIIYGDRFMRWTVLAYTLYKIDRGDLSVIPSMENLMVSYYEHAWYPNVKNRPPMPFSSLISYLRGDGSWEDYWHDYKPVYVAAYVLEYYLLACLDQEWGTKNYPILKNVTDSLLQMWLPDRHQPTAYVDAQGTPGTIQTVEIKNIVCSVDSAMVYSALTSSAQVARLVGDTESQERYASYANDLIAHFYDQRWEWFPTNVFGSNPSEPYGTALQIGMTLPYIDGDDKIDVLKDYLVENLRVSGDSWLLKWSKDDKTVSSRSVFAAIGLAPKYPQLAQNILNAYAEAALSNEPWLLSKGTGEEPDGYEGKDPIWVSGKYLMTYVSVKNRMALGRSVFSPRLMGRGLTFESSFPSDSAGISSANASFPTLYGNIRAKIDVTGDSLRYTLSGVPREKITLQLHTAFRPSVSCTASRWGYVYASDSRFTVVWFIPDDDVEIRIRREGG